MKELKQHCPQQLKFAEYCAAKAKLSFQRAFTLVEVLMGLLIVSVILSASLPVISQRTKTQSDKFSKYSAFPIGGVIIWGSSKPLPDSTWLECNGQAVPSGIEYEEIRQIYGTNLPDYRGVFLRGFGAVTHTQNNGTVIGNTATVHSSGALGALQGDALREIQGSFSFHKILILSADNVFRVNPASTNYHNNTPQAGIVPNQIDFIASRILPVSNEIRPINKAVRYIIKVRH